MQEEVIEQGQDEKLYDVNDIKHRSSVSQASGYQHHEINCPNIGQINVHVQGNRSSNEVIIMTVPDLGCQYTMYQEFVDHPMMRPIRDRTVWVHVEAPGQSQNAADLPLDYQFPSMQAIAEDLITVLDQLDIKHVVCIGEGAGANILARFAMANIEKVLGICLLHTTGTTAGFFETLKDKVNAWKMEALGLDPAPEQYLVLHRFGGTKFSKANDSEELRTLVECYKNDLSTKINQRNLQQFVCAFLKRTSIAENIRLLTCPVLLITGQNSIFNDTTRSLHQAIMKTCENKNTIEFIEMAGVANVLEEKPDKLAECFQYFLQGLGLISSVPMHSVHNMLRNRTMSMEDWDKPLKERMDSVTASDPPPESPTTEELPKPIVGVESEATA